MEQWGHDVRLGRKDADADDPAPALPARRAPLLIGQLNEAEAFGRRIEGTMKAPQAVVLPVVFPGLGNGRPIEKPDAPASCRELGLGFELLAHDVFRPRQTVAQALKQRHVRQVRKF